MSSISAGEANPVLICLKIKTCLGSLSQYTTFYQLIMFLYIYIEILNKHLCLYRKYVVGLKYHIIA